MRPADVLIAVVALAFVACEGQACKFRDHKVIPDVIGEAPTTVLKIGYPSGAQASYGNVLTPTEVKDAPKVQAELDKDSFYTVVLVDPDVPSRKNPEQGQWLHWLVVNIPGSDLHNGDVSAGRAVAEYISSAPPEGSGLHRYVFLVYKQSGGAVEPKEEVLRATSARGRPRFNVGSYAKEHDLGSPVAGNFYQAQYDDYVPVVYSTLAD